MIVAPPPRLAAHGSIAVLAALILPWLWLTVLDRILRRGDARREKR